MDLEKERLANFVRLFRGKKVAVIGDIALDRYTEGLVERTNPEMPGAPVLRVINERHVLGCAGNVASNLASLGCKVYLFGPLHEDGNKNNVLEICNKLGVNFRYVLCQGENIVKQRMLESLHNHYIMRTDHGESNLQSLNEGEQRKLLATLEREDGWDCIVLSDYNKKVFRKSGFGEKVIEFAKRKGIQTFVDAKPGNVDSFRGASLIRPNEKEARKILEMQDESILEVIRKLREKVGSKYTVITRGKDGVVGYDDAFHEIETKAKEVVDVSGAGDTFLAALTLSLISGSTLVEASKIANYASGIVVEKPGTATVNQEELINRIRQD